MDNVRVMSRGEVCLASGRTSKKLAMALPILLAVAGCSALNVRTGRRTEIASLPIASIKVTLPDGPAIAPGEKLPLVVEITEPDGTVLVSEGKGRGKVMWGELRVSSTVALVSDKGIVSLPKDPRVSDEKTSVVTVTVPSHPGIQGKIEIPVRYNVAFTTSFLGRPGLPGTDGTNGLDGLSGHVGSFDPNNPSPGGNGSNGKDGTSGGNGGRGGDAPLVDISVAFSDLSKPLLKILVTGEGEDRYFIVDPQGGSLTVKAFGGAGGAAGKGGRGGRGGAGGMGMPNGSDGLNGLDGQDGMKGFPGNDGSFKVTYDPQAKPYLGALHLEYGSGPQPIYVEAPVSVPW